MPDFSSFQGLLNFVSSNFHIIGWVTLLGFTWKASTKFKIVIDKIITATEDAQTAKQTIELVATNHLPHLQKELEDLNTNVSGVRQDIFNFLLTVKK